MVIAYVATMADLKNVVPLGAGDMTGIRGYYAPNDGGEGEFVWDPNNAVTDNGGTIIARSGGGTGRWVRVCDNNLEFPVRWFGARGDESDDTNFIKKCIEAASIKLNAINTNVNIVKFSPGKYRTNGIEFAYGEVQIEGAGALSTRIIQNDNQPKPLVYIKGGSYLEAMPNGGIRGVSLTAGSHTYPSIVYVDSNIDNQANFDDLRVEGSDNLTNSSLGVDGFSFHDFLNFSHNKFRSDGITGYAIRIRASSVNAVRSTISSGYRSSSVNTGSGAFSLSKGGAEKITPMINGAACLIYTSGTLPTVLGPNPQIVTAPNGGVYYMGSNTASEFTLYYSAADAKSNTNPIKYTAAGTGPWTFVVFRAHFPVSSVANNVLLFTNDKNCLIPTSVPDADGKTFTYGTGMTGAVTFGGTGAVHAVFVAAPNGGTLPSALSPNTPYYPIYINSIQIYLASTIDNAKNGIPISMPGTQTISGMVILYDHSITSLGIGSYSVTNLTYDNGGSQTAETVNGTPCGGWGVLYADYQNWNYKGPIHIDGNRVEINKTLARDPVYGNGARSLFRIQAPDPFLGPNVVQLKFSRMTFESKDAIRGDSYRIVANSGSVDVAPSFEDCQINSACLTYDNDLGTANSKGLPIKDGDRGVISLSIGNASKTNTPGQTDGVYFSSLYGRQISPLSSLMFATSFSKKGDLLLSDDPGIAFYLATQSSIGWCTGNGGSVSAGTTVSSTADSNVFNINTLSGIDNLNVGCSIAIAGVGAGGTTLIGVISVFDPITSPPYFKLINPTTGLPLNASISLGTAAVTFMTSTYASIVAKYTGSTSHSFGNIGAGQSPTVLIGAPTGVTLSTSKPVTLGLPSDIPNNIYFTGYVTAGGASVTVRATNHTSGSIFVPTGTFSYEVSV